MVPLGPDGNFGLRRMPGLAFGCSQKDSTPIGESWKLVEYWEFDRERTFRYRGWIPILKVGVGL